MYAYLNALREDENACIYGQTDWLAGSGFRGFKPRDGKTGLKLSLRGRKSARTLPFRRFLREVSLFHAPKYRLHFQLRGLAVPTRHFTLVSSTILLNPHFLTVFYPCHINRVRERKSEKEREKERKKERLFRSLEFFFLLAVL